MDILIFDNRKQRIENSKLKEKVTSQNLEIIDLKNKLKVEAAKYKILKYNKNITSQSRSSIFEYKTRIKQILQLFNLELQKVKFSLDSVKINNMLIPESLNADLTMSSINTEATAMPNIEINTSTLDSELTEASSSGATGSISIIENTLITQMHKNFTLAYNDPFVENTVDKCLFYKDKISLADHKYHSFRNGMNFKKNMAPLSQIRKRKIAINNDVDVTELSSGFFIDPERYIKLQIKYYLAKRTLNVNRENIIWVKLTCDGTQISRNVTITNFAFSIINEKIKAATASGCYRIGAFQQRESYDEIKEWLPVLWHKIKALKRIKYDPINEIITDISDAIEPFSLADPQNTYEIRYFFSADWKIMAIILGLKGATSDYPCLYCEQTKGSLDKIGL
jgi:hypothetical protein